MRKQVALIISILMISSVFQVAAAEPGQRDIDIDRMANHLDLDETQKQAIENIRLAAQPEFEALKIKMQEIQAARKELADRVRGEVAAVLTDEQRAKLAENRPGKDGQRRRMFNRDGRDDGDTNRRRRN